MPKSKEAIRQKRWRDKNRKLKQKPNLASLSKDQIYRLRKAGKLPPVEKTKKKSKAPIKHFDNEIKDVYVPSSYTPLSIDKHDVRLEKLYKSIYNQSFSNYDVQDRIDENKESAKDIYYNGLAIPTILAPTRKDINNVGIYTSVRYLSKCYKMGPKRVKKVIKGLLASGHIIDNGIKRIVTIEKECIHKKTRKKYTITLHNEMPVYTLGPSKWTFYKVIAYKGVVEKKTIKATKKTIKITNGPDIASKYREGQESTFDALQKLLDGHREQKAVYTDAAYARLSFDKNWLDGYRKGPSTPTNAVLRYADMGDFKSSFQVTAHRWYGSVASLSKEERRHLLIDGEKSESIDVTSAYVKFLINAIGHDEGYAKAMYTNTELAAKHIKAAQNLYSEINESENKDAYKWTSDRIPDCDRNKAKLMWNVMLCSTKRQHTLIAKGDSEGFRVYEKREANAKKKMKISFEPLYRLLEKQYPDVLDAINYAINKIWVVEIKDNYKNDKRVLTHKSLSDLLNLLESRIILQAMSSLEVSYRVHDELVVKASDAKRTKERLEELMGFK